jgi:putative DNA primase/helicase
MLRAPVFVNQNPPHIVPIEVDAPTASLLRPEIVQAAERGWKVFPLQVGTKDGQLLKSWKEEASSDINQVAKWAIRWPGSNWGLATGAGSGVFVVDLDSVHAMAWALDAGLPIDGYRVKTGKNDPLAAHYYFRQPAGVRVQSSQGKLYFGVDVRGDGGYVVFPPSIHPTGNRYRVETDAEAAAAPQWLLELVKPTERQEVRLSDLGPLSDDQVRHGKAALAKKCREFEALPADQGQRNLPFNKLSFFAGQLVARGYFEREFAEEAVLDAGAAYIAKDRNHKRTFYSGFVSGLAEPLELEEFSPEDAGFGLAPLPPGASLTPPPAPSAGGTTLTSEERMLANLATQHSIALIFARRMNGKMLYDHTRKVWMEYDGTRWAVDELKKVHNFILNIASEMNTENKASMVTSSFCDGVDRHLRSFPEFSRTSKEFDRDHYLLNTPAGTIDLRTGKMRQHDPADMITLCTTAAPDTAGDGPTFRNFLMQITGGDEDLIRFHQISLGACLSGAVEDHWLLFWYGVPRAGKNTLGELVEALMGDYARTVPTSTLMSKKFESHPTEMANLQGIRLATSSELSDGDHWNEARIKQLTGDATLSARWIGGNFFEFERTFKLLVYGNYKPQLRSADDALRARLKIVPFNVSFVGREDKGLPGRLRAEMGYVLQWLLEGHQQWLAAEKKVPRCAAVEAEISHYFEGQSTPKLWLKECCEILLKDDRPDLQLHTVVECYRSYKNWKEARGESPLSQTRWQPEALQGLETVRTRRGLCVRKLHLLPLNLPFALPVPQAVPTFTMEPAVN